MPSGWITHRILHFSQHSLSATVAVLRSSAVRHCAMLPSPRFSMPPFFECHRLRDLIVHTLFSHFFPLRCPQIPACQRLRHAHYIIMPLFIMLFHCIIRLLIFIEYFTFILILIRWLPFHWVITLSHSITGAFSAGISDEARPHASH